MNGQNYSYNFLFVFAIVRFCDVFAKPHATEKYDYTDITNHSFEEMSSSNYSERRRNKVYVHLNRCTYTLRVPSNKGGTKRRSGGMGGYR